LVVTIVSAAAATEALMAMVEGGVVIGAFSGPKRTRSRSDVTPNAGHRVGYMKFADRKGQVGYDIVDRVDRITSQRWFDDGIGLRQLQDALVGSRLKPIHDDGCQPTRFRTRNNIGQVIRKIFMG